jgi:hypothetical protein
VFPSLLISQGKSYDFCIESPKAAPGDAITVYANALGQYADGEEYRNDQAVSGDLRHNRKSWMVKAGKVMYPWVPESAKTTESHRKDTPCSRRPQMSPRRKHRKSKITG